MRCEGGIVWECDCVKGEEEEEEECEIVEEIVWECDCVKGEEENV